MRTRWVATVAAFAIGAMLTTNAVHAQGKAGKTPKTTSTTPTTNAGKSAAAKPVKTTTTSTATSTAGKGKKSATTTAASSPKGNSKKSTTTAATTTSTGTSTTSTTTSTGTTSTAWKPTNAVSEKLASKSNLMTKAQKVVGADVDLNAATYGFTSFGQFMAAVNASNNHGIKFEDLHAAMTGYTYKGTANGESTLSLGQALKQLKPGIDADAAADAATQQATKETGGQ